MLSCMQHPVVSSEQQTECTPRTNYHTHCELDDGKSSLEEYVLRARDLGYDHLGFSCHTPMAEDDAWHLKKCDFPRYLEDVRDLKEYHRSSISIHTGLELDYLELTGELAGSQYMKELDYTIGSVHMMYHRRSQSYLSVDGPVEEFETLLAENFAGDIRSMVAYYFKLQEQMITMHTFDILGHCDLIKKRNTDCRFFDPDEPWYRELALTFLKSVKTHGVRIEVNSGGIARGATHEVYPAPWMLQECARLGIPVVLSSDAHDPEHLAAGFDLALQAVTAAGIGEIQYLDDAQRWESHILSGP